jgi:hypothetical protein
MLDLHHGSSDGLIVAPNLLGEAYWFGEGVLPILRDRGVWSHPDQQATDRRSAEGAEGAEGAERMVPFAVA